MSKASLLLSALSFSLVSSIALAGAVPSNGSCVLSEPERHTVAEVKDGETLLLADGRAVRLIGAKAPSVPASKAADQPAPFAAAAAEALRALAQGAEVELRYGGTRTDRHGRALAQVFVVKGEERLWLQAEMVVKGRARVYSFPDNRACLAELLAHEVEAREKRLGLWGSAAYDVLDASDPERLGRLTRTFQLVEGVVAAVGEGKSRIYINFAEDWRSDFTVSVDRKDEKDFAAAQLDLRSLVGKRIRVRGWLGWRNGPMIEATHAEQIEVLPSKTPNGSAALQATEPLQQSEVIDMRRELKRDSADR